MAIVRSLAIGKARKSAGNLTYQIVKGRTLVREKPMHVFNPDTPAQQAQRAKMRNLVEAWRGWFQLCAPYFTKIDGYGTAYNQFIKLNMPIANTSWVNELSGEVWLRNNTCVSFGRFGEASLSIHGGWPPLVVSVESLDLRRLVEQGDHLIFISSSELPGGIAGSPVIYDKVLTAQEAETLRNGGTVSMNVDTFEYSALFFYSSSKRISTTAYANL